METQDGQQIGTVTDIEGEQLYVNFAGTEMEKERQQAVHVHDIDEVADGTIVLVRNA